MHRIIFLFFLILTNILGYAQDTILVEPSFFYSSDTEPLQGKEFMSRVQYAREDIFFNENHQRIEYCYYFNKERKCEGIDYKVLNDSTILVDDLAWNYQKIADEKYLITHIDSIDEIHISGYASSLIPLLKLETFYITSIKTKDTLWTEDYSNCILNNPRSEPEYCFYESKIADKIYNF